MNPIEVPVYDDPDVVSVLEFRRMNGVSCWRRKSGPGVEEMLAFKRAKRPGWNLQNCNDLGCDLAAYGTMRRLEAKSGTFPNLTELEDC